MSPALPAVGMDEEGSINVLEGEHADGLSPNETKSKPTTISDEPRPVEEASSIPWKPSKHFKFISIVQYIACFVVSVDASILTSTLPNLANALNIDATKSFWIATSYLLTSAVFQPPIASLSDVFGRRAIYFLSVSLFTVGTVICCACNDIVGMLAGRAVQGIGGGGILSLNLIILSDCVPLRQRAQYQGYIQLVFALGSNIAPIIGGALVQHGTWRWLFIINLPFCVIAAAAVPFIIRYERPPATFQSRMLSIDWIGMGLFIVSLTTFLVGISWGGSQYSWSSAATLCPLILGLAGVGLTVVWEARGAKKPFMRLSLFQTRSSWATHICTVVLAFLIYGCLFYFVYWLLVVQDKSSILSGAGLLAFGLTIVPTSGLVGTVISKTGRYTWAIRSGWIICTLGMGLLVLLRGSTPTVAYVFIFLACGLGQGLLLISLSAAAQAVAEERDKAYAGSMYAFMRSLGQVLGVAICSTIFQNFLARRLQVLGLDTAIARDAEGYVAVLKAMPPSPEKEKVFEAYEWAFRMLFATMTGVSGVGLGVGYFVGGFSLDKELDSEHTLRKTVPKEG